MTSPYILRKGVSRVNDLLDGPQAVQFIAAGAKTVYYVENNAGNDSNDGLSWEQAFKTLAVAMAASHADISSGSTGWASRNVIYLKADTTAETLVTLAQKTTIIGVGSCDGNGNARVTGAHTPSGTYAGCHFVNVDFIGAAGATTIFTLVSGQSGIEFHGCRFMSGSTTNVAAITATAVSFLKIKDCTFLSDWTDSGRFTTAAVNIAAGQSDYTDIDGNTFIQTVGGQAIKIDTAKTGRGSWIRNNHIFSTALAIDEESDTMYCIDNRIIAGVNAAAGTSVDLPDLLSLNNLVTGADGNTLPVPAFNSGFGA